MHMQNAASALGAYANLLDEVREAVEQIITANEGDIAILDLAKCIRWKCDDTTGFRYIDSAYHSARRLEALTLSLHLMVQFNHGDTCHDLLTPVSRKAGAVKDQIGAL